MFGAIPGEHLSEPPGVRLSGRRGMGRGTMMMTDRGDMLADRRRHNSRHIEGEM